ncbi:MAG: DEAD/DEAH box helicase [Alphaproteobacteria bacterium]
MTEFEGVVPALGEALNQRGFDVLTPVQEAVLAPALADADLLVSAQTGSGKTVAFGLALAPALLAGVRRFASPDAPMALVVAPTRELALQVRRELAWLYEPAGASIVSCVGGMDMRTERRALERGAHMVVGTPGRLRDHIERGSLDIKAVKGVVLDEADEMLDLGFREDLEYILGAAPKERRTLMFSATVPRAIANLARRYQRDAVRLSTQAEQSQHVDIEYRALVVAPNDRENAIINILRYFEAQTALVFCGTRAAVNHMTARFTNRGFSVVALSGELSQTERSRALQAMRDGRARICIATDVAARGIDLPKCELVIHADLPRNREGLLHRSGRTGRAGRKGVSVLVVPYNWRKRTERLLAGAGIQAVWGKPPSVVEIMRRDDERIMADPDLSLPMAADEQTLAQDLLARHGAEQVAAAFVRRLRAGRSAPEELLDAGPAERAGTDKMGKRRDGFKDGVWVSLSVGRKQNAEPRWLLPMLCKAGHITKRDIGAIRIEQNETHVELAPGCVAGFLEALGPSATVEKNITVSRSDGPPTASKGAGKKPHGTGGRGAPATMVEADKPPAGDEQSGQATKRPKNKRLKKAKKSRLAQARLKDDTAAKQGCGPLKRSRPKVRAAKPSRSG